MARNAIMTPTNVSPRNGNVMVFDENDQIPFSFTNNSDSLAYFRYDFYDCATNENVLNVVFHNFKYKDNKPVLTHQRGDTIRVNISRNTFNHTFIDGRHYKYKITLYCCNPDETGKYLNVPNCFIPYASGRVTYVHTPSEMTIQDHIWRLQAPSYWGESELLIACSYIKIGNEERKIIEYNSLTGEITLETPFSTETISDVANLQYRLFCNYISTNGSESEGSYDFYVRNEIESEATHLPVPVGLRCNCTYTHPNNVGLENYRFRVYALNGDNYINGTVQATTSEISDLVDRQNIPIEHGITNNLIGKSIIFEYPENSNSETIITKGIGGKIVNYNASTGIVSLEKPLPISRPVGNRYSISLNKRELIADSGSVYSYHMCYNFPIYTFGESFEVETTLTTYEKQTLTLLDKFSVAMPTKDCPISECKVVVNDDTNTIIISFPNPKTATNTTNMGWYNVYRREKGNARWNYIGFVDDNDVIGNTVVFTDYLAGNNRNYEYLIAKSVNSTDTANKVYIPNNNYKPYKINDISTNWDGWTITSLIPYTNYGTYYNKNDVRTNEISNRLSFVFSKEPFIVGETWHFVSAINSGDISHNLGITTHVGTSSYPTVTRSNNDYESGTFTADLLSLTCPNGEIYDDIEKVERWERFINGDNLFLLKSEKGDVWVIAISDNTSRSYDEITSCVLTNVSYNWVEVMKAENIITVKE